MDKFCSNCRKSLTTEINFCPNCGMPTSSYSPASNISANAPKALTSLSKNPLQISTTESRSNPYDAPSNPYAISPLTPPPPPPPHRNMRFGILIGIDVLVLILIGGSVFALLRQRANETTSVPDRTPLYTADWSSGLNGWTGTSDWTAVDGMLHNDGTDSTANAPTMVAPYQVEGRTDYAVEANVQVEAGIGCFDVTTIRATGSENSWQGYKLIICSGRAEIRAGNITGLSSEIFAHINFNAGKAWHTYLFGAKGTMLSLTIDNKLLLEVNDSRYLSGGKLGFKSFETQLNVSSFKVFAL